MGAMQRNKGARRERQIVAMHNAIGVKSERVPLSGAVRYQGNGADVDVYARGADAAPFVCEVKARASGEGFATIERWLGENDALFLIRDQTVVGAQSVPPLVVLPWSRWAELIGGQRE